MPEICRFYGIVIKMYFADHAPPHFHAEYAEHEARIAINNLGVLSGDLPPRAMGLVVEWERFTSRNFKSCGVARAIWSRSTALTLCHKCTERHNTRLHRAAARQEP